MRESFLQAQTPEEITSEPFYPPGSYLARQFSDDRFPAELALLARKHKDYPKRDPESQLLFIARFIAGAGSTTPEYSLRLTRNLLDETQKRTQRRMRIAGQKPPTKSIT
jgi:hypothetical protein